MTSHSSSFTPWATAAPLAPEAEAASAAGNGADDALERAAADLSQAASQWAELSRQNGAAPAGNGGGSPLALQITVSDPLGDETPYAASSLGPDLSLLP